MLYRRTINHNCYYLLKDPDEREEDQDDDDDEERDGAGEESEVGGARFLAANSMAALEMLARLRGAQAAQDENDGVGEGGEGEGVEDRPLQRADRGGYLIIGPNAGPRYGYGFIFILLWLVRAVLGETVEHFLRTIT